MTHTKPNFFYVRVGTTACSLLLGLLPQRSCLAAYRDCPLLHPLARSTFSVADAGAASSTQTMATLLGVANAASSPPANLQVRLADLAGDKFKVSEAPKQPTALHCHRLAPSLTWSSLPTRCCCFSLCAGHVLCRIRLAPQRQTALRRAPYPLHLPHSIASLLSPHSHSLPRARLSSAPSPQDLPRFFSPTAAVVWEGNSVTGSQQLTHLFSVLPPTKHTLTSIDSHPITPLTATASAAAAAAAPQSLLVSISGTVVYGLDSGGVRGFFHSFVLGEGQRRRI